MSYSYPFENFRALWDLEPLIISDTNGLLNIYRFSPGTTGDILKIFEQISDQIWLPAQVLEEFNRNHKNVVNKERNKYREVKAEVERITDRAKNDFEKQFLKFGKFRFPQVKELGSFVESAIEGIRSKSQEYESQITEEVEKNKAMLNEDKVKLFVDALVQNGRVGNAYSIATLLSIFSEGEKRYEYQIPPGYNDIGKDKDDPTKRQKFGDLILWKQILDQARICQKPIIFITMDEKEDWWVLDEKNKHVPLRPRDELFIEFKEYSDHELALMSLTQFVRHITQINDIIIGNKTYLELNSDLVSRDLIEQADWSVIMVGSDLTSYFIHSGELQDFLDNSLADVELEDFSIPNITISSVDIDEDQVVIEGRFESEVETIVTESYSKHYSTKKRVQITIRGSISLEFTADFSKEENLVEAESVEVKVGGFEILDVGYYGVDSKDFDDDYDNEDYNESCVDCGNPNISYFMENDDPICQSCSICYKTCSDCGRLFDSGMMGGAFCISCEGQK
ncbi:PIN domain-containing protein [Cohnella abietis]|uniref:PIN like domain-containing protein n=1 Tax=Cohnella abietis TaxID=2507935 RepID=A0A3T1CZ86_9BACL|nr:PIN domain-containing protein [Cohnella abietis]BBI31144.1 hypothetical protein KCTCHS21_05430 [Cohnella abietis]